MQHALVAVFDNRNDAQQALDDLLASGFSRQEVRLSEGDAAMDATPSTAPTRSDDHSFTAGIKNFFADVFGTDRHEDARMYSDAVSRGNCVLTLNAVSEPEVERAADIVERYGPIDIDEHAQQWFGQPGMQVGGATAQQAPSMSQQFAPGAADTGSRADFQGGRGDLQRGDTTAIPVIQEALKIGKRAIERGGVRIYQHVVETPVNETVGLREEHVNVERHAVDRPVTAADAGAFHETTIELRETAEEAVVQKTARVVEEVIVGKQVTERNEQISDTVRRTEVEIEQLTPQDDAYFRGHWSSNFSSEGGMYEDYAPAYSYGSSMARSDVYRGQAWDVAEPNLRSDWETRYPGSAWERFKAAVRHGWERMTS